MTRPDHARRPRRWLLLGGVIILVLAVAAAGWWVVRPDGRATTATPDPVGQPGPPRTDPLRVQLPLNPAELSPAELDRALDQAVAAGAREISAGVTWWFVTEGRAPDAYDWTAIDRLVDAAAGRGLAVRLQLSGTPDAVHPELAASVPDLGERIWYPPRTPAELDQWGTFVRDTVGHFAGRVASFEMWNEPNISDFWKPEPSPAEYAALLERAYRSAKQAAPAAQVVFGGLSHNDLGYLQRYYAEVRKAAPDAKANRYFFDVLDVHPYTDGRSPDDTSADTVVLGKYGPVDKSFAGLRRMKALLDREEGGGAGKPVVIGEYGFTTAGTDFAPAVPDRRRAYFLKRAFAIAERLSFVRGLSWYGYLPDSSNDAGWAIAAPGRYDSWTYQALVDVSTGRARAPTVTLAASTRPGTEVRPALAGVAAADIEHTELWVDGTLRAESDGPSVSWAADADFAGGRVQVVVYTTDRHAWPSAVLTVPRAG